MKIYTRTGDRGETSLANGERVVKNSAIISFVGHLDEINAHLGICNSLLHIEDKFSEEVEFLRKIQNDLFVIGSICVYAKLDFDIPMEVLILEKQIDKYEKILPRLTNFILPGGNIAASQIHLLRTSVRKMEINALNTNEKMIIKFIPYFNRLSDYLFVLGRLINYKNNHIEPIWKSTKNQK